MGYWNSPSPCTPSVTLAWAQDLGPAAIAVVWAWETQDRVHFYSQGYISVLCVMGIAAESFNVQDCK